MRWIFAHELTHLRRRDAWSALLFGVGQILFFFVPWFWWLRRQVRLCQEYVADAAAAAQDDQAVPYAEFLVSLAGTPAVPAGASAVSGQGSDLYRRVTMLLQDPLRVETRCPRRWTVLAAGGLLAVAVLVAGFGYRAEAAADDTIVIIIRPDGDNTADQTKQTIRVYVAPADAAKQTSKNLVQGDQASRVLGDKDRIQTLAELLTNKNIGNDAIKSGIEAAQLLLQNQAVPGDQQKLKPPTNDVQDSNRQQQMETLEELKRLLNEWEKNKPSSSLADVMNRVTQDQTKANELLEKLRASSTKPARPSLGASVETISPVLKEQLGLPGNVGIVVTKVQPDSPAEKAGIQVNDVLLKIDGALVPGDLEDFQKLIAALKSDTPFDVVVMRKGQKQKVGSLTLAAETPGPAAEKTLERKAFLDALNKQVERKAALEALKRLDKLGGARDLKSLMDKKGKDKDTVTTTVTRKGNAISVKHQEDGTVFTLNANLKDDTLEIGAITVEDAQGVHNYKTLVGLTLNRSEAGSGKLRKWWRAASAAAKTASDPFGKQLTSGLAHRAGPLVFFWRML